MKPLMVWLLLLVAPLFGADTTITIDTFPTEQNHEPGVVVVLTVEDLPEGVEYDWHQVPELRTDSIRKGKDEQNRPVLFFSGVEKGLRTFLLQEAKEGLDPIARIEFGYGIKPPDPPPPPPGRKWQVVIVYESGDLVTMPRDQLVIIASLDFREKLKKVGHHLLLGGVVDIDRIDDLPEKVVPYVRSCEGDPMPRIAFAPIDGGDITDLPLPANEAAVFKLLDEGPPGAKP